MSSSDSNFDSRKGTHKPRVKSFLQKASAIIASEKGLNAAAQQKLQTLAEHLKMPQAEFRDALALLQETEQLPVGLNRYEKEFLEFLQFEFEQIKSGIITISMEDKAVDLAARKYDIQEARARRLIHEKAESMEVRRISKSEAENYVEQLITSRIGDAIRIDEPARERFYQIARKWGVDGDHVDKVVLQALAANRRTELEQQGVTRRPWVTAALAVLLPAVGVVFAVNAHKWWNADQVSKDPVKKDPVVKLEEVTWQNPGWWKESGVESALKRLENDEAKAEWVQLLASDELDERTEGLRRLLGRLWDSEKPQDFELQSFLAAYFYRCPDPNFSNRILVELKEGLSLPASRLPAQISKMELGYKANRLLGFFFHYKIENEGKDWEERKAWVDQAVYREFGATPKGEEAEGYLDRTNRVVAINQWNHLLQTSWASPGRTSTLIGPLFELTQSKLGDQELQRLHRRTVMSVLESDQELWSNLKDEIARAVDTSPVDALNTWINQYQAASSEDYRGWLGRQLVAKCNLDLEAASRAEIADALNQFKTQNRREQFRELLVRSEKVDRLSDEVRNAFRTTNMSPQLIADVARVVTLSMYLSPMDQSSFQYARFDLLYRKGTPNLERLARTSIDEQHQSSGDATRSDKQQKQETLKQLQTLARDKRESRLTSLRRLADVAERFADIPYSEAKVLADYYLKLTNDRERVQAEKLLPKFVDWPSFGLAVVDQLEDSKTTLDQALTIAQFYSEDSFELKEAVFWRDETRKFILDAVVRKIEQANVEVTEASQQWYFLRADYIQLLELRLEALGENPLSFNRSEPVEMTRAMVEVLLNRIPGGVEYPVKRATRVLENQSTSELEELVALNKLLVKLLARYVGTRWPDRAIMADRISESVEGHSQRTSGEVLLKTELALLELWELEREAIVKRLLTR